MSTRPSRRENGSERERPVSVQLMRVRGNGEMAEKNTLVATAPRMTEL
jgi:hypothetical protein